MAAINMYLVIVDTAQIQPYVFGSNRLRESIGGSYLVAQATGEWACKALPPGSSGVGTSRPNDAIEAHPDVPAEMIYTGGGNAVALFRDRNGEKGARHFVGCLSRKALREAPGLRLVVTTQKFVWNEEILRDRVDDAFQDLARRKVSEPLSAPLLGLSVTAMCRSTGLPATGMTEMVEDDAASVYPASDETQAKLKAAWPRSDQGKRRRSPADDRLHASLPLANACYDFPADFDRLGRSEGEHSYIAVVHADGNDTSKRIIQVGQRFGAPGESRCYIETVRGFSCALNEAARRALHGTVVSLEGAVRSDKVGRLGIPHPTIEHNRVPLLSWMQGNGWFLPFRPIVFGGDDVTFVCDGRLGISLAVDYLQRFEAETGKEETRQLLGGAGMSASAGVAIVKAHFPFARAYALADELCKEAKAYRRQERGPNGSCLDWHFVTSGITGGLGQTRMREYMAGGCPLTLRPVSLDCEPDCEFPFRSWKVVGAGVAKFQRPKWLEKRNKMKALRDTLRQGPGAEDRFLALYEQGALDNVGVETGALQSPGWTGSGHCTHYDAIELADWFIPLGEDVAQWEK